MMKRFTHLAIMVMLCMSMPLAAQDYGNAYGIRGGLTIATQKWNSQEREPMLSYHGAISVDILSGKKMSFCTEIGYHRKGSSIIQRATSVTDQNGSVIQLPRRVDNFTFDNLGLMLGVKSRYGTGQMSYYWLMGARAEYTVSYDLLYFQGLDQAVNRFTAGMTLGGGVEWRPKNSKCSLFTEFQVNPDFTRQIFSPPGEFYNTYTMTYFPLPQQEVRNVTFELSLGIRFNDTYSADELEEEE